MSYADVNGLSLYYEEHGAGDPLSCCTAASAPASMFGPLLPRSPRPAGDHGRPPGPGRTADIDRPLRPERWPTTSPR